MDAFEDSTSCNQANETIESLQPFHPQDRKKSLLASSSEEGHSDNVSSNKVKKVRFSDQVDYCNFYTDTIGNEISTLSEEHSNEIPCEILEVEDLASEIMSLNISSISTETEKVLPSSESNMDDSDLNEHFDSEKDHDRKLMLQEKEKKSHISSVEKQRNGNLLKQKQTKRLNDLLRRDLNNSKANDFKTAVYQAWTAVKNETKENLPTFVSNKSEDENTQRSVHLAYVLWKKTKDKELRCSKKVKGDKNLLSSHSSQESVKSEKEDNEMAFISWKKRKDKLLKQETYSRIQNERNAAEIALMNEEEKRKDGESAFLAWKAHKAQVSREERKKMILYKEKEKQTIEEKETRDMESLHMYILWVKSKSYVKQRKWSKQIMKPPWYPPGSK